MPNIFINLYCKMHWSAKTRQSLPLLKIKIQTFITEFQKQMLLKIDFSGAHHR